MRGSGALQNYSPQLRRAVTRHSRALDLGGYKVATEATVATRWLQDGYKMATVGGCAPPQSLLHLEGLILTLKGKIIYGKHTEEEIGAFLSISLHIFLCLPLSTHYPILCISICLLPCLPPTVNYNYNLHILLKP
jgi:hypothetical protein